MARLPRPAAAVLAALPLVLGMGAGWAVRGRTRDAYATLAPERPAWAKPPAWVFAPVWTVLYVLIGVAAWTAFTSPRARGWALAAALAAYVVQTLLNAAWTPVYFGAGARRAALGVLLALDVAVVATIAAFAVVSPAAAWMLAPYAAWLGYATALNWVTA